MKFILKTLGERILSSQVFCDIPFNHNAWMPIL